MTAINDFLLAHDLRIRTNPCVSPDFCLDWPAFAARIAAGRVVEWRDSPFVTEMAHWTVVEDPETGDCAWKAALRPGWDDVTGMDGGVRLDDRTRVFPTTFANLLALKNHVQRFDAESTIFPTAAGSLGRSTLGVGARWTTLHWPAVEWTMAVLGMGLTANQNSIPRELVYDVDAMLEGRLETVPFPFVGADVPEGHQGQSVEGMSQGAVLSKLRTGFHRRDIPWSFNADHQPIGGRFDAREARLVDGCVLASYITFDLSPELAVTTVPADPEAWVRAAMPAGVLAHVTSRVSSLELDVRPEEQWRLLAWTWPAMQKMKRRDAAYTRVRAERFETVVGREYLRELSIDELPGLTEPATTATMLALCEALDVPIHFVAPAFGFQKNAPFPDDDELRRLVERQWRVCHAFDVSLGFHSGSGKSAENYAVMGSVTGGRLEVKTSGRYTYEMGRALAASSDRSDKRLWRDWYAFTVDLAVAGAHSSDPTERQMARTFVTDALQRAGRATDVFASAAATRAAIDALTPSPDHMFWFEYNFLFVLAAGGRAEKSALGDHGPEGYRQRARFYGISDEARLRYLKNVAAYLLFLAEHTGLASARRCEDARRQLDGYATLDAFLVDIAPDAER